jgi:hypothetical protein
VDCERVCEDQVEPHAALLLLCDFYRPPSFEGKREVTMLHGEYQLCRGMILGSAGCGWVFMVSLWHTGLALCVLGVVLREGQVAFFESEGVVCGGEW